MFFFLEFGERIGKRIIKNREEALLEASMRERFLSSKREAISAALVGGFGGAGRKRFHLFSRCILINF